MDQGVSIRLLYDGKCPICSREVRWLRRRAARRGAKLGFEDIAAPGFDPARYGLTAKAVRDQMHGVLPDGSVVRGVEVFRQAYAAVGLGWLLGWTRWPGLRLVADAGYAVFAKLRPHLSRFGRGCDETCGLSE